MTVNFSIIEVSKIWQAKPFEIANLTKKAWLLLQMDAFPNVILVNKAAFELQERTRVKETILLPGEKECNGQLVSISFKGKNDIILWWVIIVDKCVKLLQNVTI